MASPAEVRQRCLWLAQLASFRGGLIARLVKQAGSFADVMASRDSELRAHIGAASRPRNGAVVVPGGDEARFRELFANGARGYTTAGPPEAAVTWGQAEYPRRLRDLYDPPPAVFLLGDGARALAELTERPVVALVGSRAPSPYGLEMSTALAADLAGSGVVVLSGLAQGIDAAAHKGALAGFRGGNAAALATVAVLGSGVDVVYPRTNARLFSEVRRAGLLISEFSWGVPARAWRFPARNRLIAALAGAVVVVEGSDRSGSLITAEYALDLGREVLAVPGEAGRRLSAGPHKLLRMGATLCESAADILDALALDMGAGATGARVEAAPAFVPGSAAERMVYDALAKGPATVDRLVGGLGLSAAAVAGALSTLELEGVVSAALGSYRLRSGR